jgi:S-adenosyl-L-methionine hydrolase (adenosine-forming)
MSKRVTLLTDFGTADGYVAAMKGAITQIAPNVVIDDASHDIPPGDTRAAAIALRRYWRLYPRGTVHVVVIDPGVGSARKALVVQADERILIGPDNGVFTLVLNEAESWTAYSAERSEFFRSPLSNTFHGRDVFAPLAAHLASGRAAAEVGPGVDAPVRLDFPAPTRDGERVTGEIVYVDHFGNLVSNIPATMITTSMRVRVGTFHLIPLSHAYSEGAVGSAIALINSDDVLEIGVRDGNAAHHFRIGRGARVELIPTQ